MPEWLHRWDRTPKGSSPLEGSSLRVLFTLCPSTSFTPALQPWPASRRNILIHCDHSYSWVSEWALSLALESRETMACSAPQLSVNENLQLARAK